MSTLAIAAPKLYYQLTIRDRHGRVVSRTRRHRARSLIRQYADILYNLASFTTNAALDIGNVSRTLGAATSPYYLRMDGAAANGSLGPVVGTGSTAVDISDYALAGKIAEGTGSGQMSHLVTTFTAPALAGQTVTWKVARIFVNSSGASITINEVGLYAIRADQGGLARYFLIVRDLVSGGQAVPNGGAATLEYTWSITA